MPVFDNSFSSIAKTQHTTTSISNELDDFKKESEETFEVIKDSFVKIKDITDNHSKAIDKNLDRIVDTDARLLDYKKEIANRLAFDEKRINDLDKTVSNLTKWLIAVGAIALVSFGGVLGFFII